MSRPKVDFVKSHGSLRIRLGLGDEVCCVVADPVAVIDAPFVEDQLQSVLSVEGNDVCAFFGRPENVFVRWQVFTQERSVGKEMYFGSGVDNEQGASARRFGFGKMFAGNLGRSRSDVAKDQQGQKGRLRGGRFFEFGAGIGRRSGMVERRDWLIVNFRSRGLSRFERALDPLQHWPLQITRVYIFR